MQAGVSPARPARAQHRHELRTLTYVTLNQTNGGIVRNLTHEGIAVQAVAAVRCGQRLHVRFELRDPRLRVETFGEVMWATASGQCGIRFLDLSPRTRRQINEWIFGSLLQGLSPRPDPEGSMFGGLRFAESRRTAGSSGTGAADQQDDEDDGLMVSAAPVKVIELPLRPEPPEPALIHTIAETAAPVVELDWLSQPLSGRGLAWIVNTLVVLAALLLFALVFLSVIREPPQRPFAMMAGVTVLVTTLYWGFFRVFGGGSPGSRLARLRESSAED